MTHVRVGVAKNSNIVMEDNGDTHLFLKVGAQHDHFYGDVSPTVARRGNKISRHSEVALTSMSSKSK